MRSGAGAPAGAGAGASLASALWYFLAFRCTKVVHLRFRVLLRLRSQVPQVVLYRRSDM